MKRKPYRMLLIEDDDGEGVYLKKRVEMSVYPVELEQRFTLADGLAALMSEHWDGVCCDLHLPDDMNGDTVVARVYEIAHEAHIPVIVLSGYLNPEVNSRCMAHGACQCLSKIPHPENLIEVFYNCCVSYERERETKRIREEVENPILENISALLDELVDLTRHPIRYVFRQVSKKVRELFHRWRVHHA